MTENWELTTTHTKHLLNTPQKLRNETKGKHLQPGGDLEMPK